MSGQRTLHTYSLESALTRATQYYLKTCALEHGGDTPKHERMLKRSMEVLERVSPLVNIRCMTARLDGGAIDGETLTAGPVRFDCRAFGRLDPSRIRAVYPYMLTVGDIYLETDNVSDQLFADIWGTSFTDAAIELLEADIAKENPGYVLSSSFGPGFFGMGVTEMGKFFEVFDASEIGVTLRSNYLLLPLKSCAGFFISLLDEWTLPTRDCEHCLGNPGGCRFCANYERPAL